MVARANKVMVDMPMKPKESPSTVRVNLKKHPMPQSHLKLGAKMTLVIEGKVTSVNQSEYGKDMVLDVVSMKHETNGESHGHEAKEGKEYA